MESYPCPYCRAVANLDSGCPGCGRLPDPDAAEVIRLDAEIPRLRTRVDETRLAYETATALLADAHQRRATAAGRVRAAVAAARGAGRAAPLPPAPLSPAVSAPAPGGTPARPEASSRTVQNVLFVLGGMLLGTAAIVFTAVAWAAYGVGGRAAILTGVTLLALAAPPLALRRGLAATAETFAAVGLLLILLDGYAAWYVNLFGVAEGSAQAYAGGVCAVTAAVAAGYGALTRLAGPRFVALVVAQPALPLLLAPLHPDWTGWALVFAAVATANLAVPLRHRSGSGVGGFFAEAGLGTPPGASGGSPGGVVAVPGSSAGAASDVGSMGGAAADAGSGSSVGAVPGLGSPGAGTAVPGPARSDGVAAALRTVAWVAYGGALVVSGSYALLALAIAGTPGRAALAGAALVVAALVLVAGSLVARSVPLLTVAGATVALALAVSGAQVVVAARGPYTAVLLAAVIAALALAVVATAPLLPAAVRIGPRLAAVVVTGVGALLAFVATAHAALGAVTAAQPAWHAALGTRSGPYDWQLPAALALLTAALAVLVPRAARPDTALAGGALLALALPLAVPAPWWVAPAVAVAAALGLGTCAVRAAQPGAAALRSAAAAPLAGYAVLTALVRPGSTAAVLAALALTGAVVAGLGLRRPAAHHRVVGGLALAAGLVAVPGAVAAGLVALRVEPWWVARGTVAAGALLVLALWAVGRWWSAYLWYAFAAVLGVVALDPLWAVTGPTREASSVYAAVALVLAGVAWTLVPRSPTAVGVAVPAVVLPALWWIGAVAPALWTVLGRPYEWLTAVWAGAPRGVGLAPSGPTVDAADAVSLALVAVAVAVPVAAWAGRRAGSAAAGVWLGAAAAARFVGPAVPAGLAAGGAAWPTVPAVSLGLGLTGLVAAALNGRATRTGTAAPNDPSTSSGSFARMGTQADTTPEGTGVTGGAGPAGSTGSHLGRILLLVPIALLLTGSGLAGALPTKPTTLGALGLTLAAAVTIGAAGRSPAARLAGWLSAVATGVLLAIAAGLAADVSLPAVAFGVLAVAAAALALGAALRARRPAESAALQAAAQAGALTALVLTIGAIEYAATVCTLWGIALGLRALWPGERPVPRRAYVATAAGVELLAWWLLVAAADVTLVEAYTLPAAGVALLAGWLALRTRPELSSWLGYGPALAAAFLPSLAAVYVVGGHPERRLLIGVGALVVVVAGALRRRQAPVVVGGGALVLVALHELARVWDLLPRWIPLAAGGLLLVGLAMTLERRRRDLARVRRAVGRMT